MGKMDVVVDTGKSGEIRWSKHEKSQTESWQKAEIEMLMEEEEATVEEKEATSRILKEGIEREEETVSVTGAIC